MPVDTAQYPGDFDLTKPAGSDTLAEADDNFRQIKTAEKQAWPNIKGAVTASHTELNHVAGVTSAIQTQLNTLTSAKSIKAGDTYSGAHNYTGATITVPTQASSDNSTNAASTAMVQAAIASVNSQTALSTSISASTTVALSAGQHVICTNASAVTVTLTGTFAAGDTCRATFSNNLYSNVIDPGVHKIWSSSSTRTVNAKNASPVFTYANSSIGMVVA